MRFDHLTCSAGSICQPGRNPYLIFGSHGHELQHFLPSANHLRNPESCRFTTLYGAVEHGTVKQLAGVVYFHLIGFGRFRSRTLGKHLVLQTAFGRNNAFFRFVLGEEFLPFGFQGLGFTLLYSHDIFLNTILCILRIHHQGSIPFQRLHQNISEDFHINRAVGECF